MSDLIPFNFDGADVRVLLRDGEPWFVASDVARILAFDSAKDFVRGLDADEKGRQILPTLGGDQEMTVISEAGLYSAILRSRVPAAKTFKRFVTHELLPKFRRGELIAAPVELSRLELIDMARAAELARIAEAEARRLSEAKVLELEGPAAQAEVFRSSEGMCTIGDLANRFQDWALEHHPDAKVLHKHVFDHAARLGLIIRGNTVRHNQGTSQAIKAGWIKHNRVQYDTHTRGMQTKVSVRLTSRGEARLWDGLVAHLRDHSTLEIRKSA